MMMRYSTHFNGKKTEVYSSTGAPLSAHRAVADPPVQFDMQSDFYLFSSHLLLFLFICSSSAIGVKLPNTDIVILIDSH